MEHTALYRKHRPEAFDEIIGQEHIVAALEGALKLGKIAHAYLFSGSRGTGKTTTSRIIARALGTSDNDLYEIDAASNRGIDNIRELRENVGTLPFDSKYKVYIIDEVHMLTKEAFNALLKTLEEPPAHVIFILATTELEKVPETIVSRCQTFVFRKPSEKVLRTLIERTAAKEKITLKEGAAELLALLGNGSFRDALGTFQKVISAVGTTISRADVEQVTGAPQISIVHDLIEAIASGSRADALAVIAHASEARQSLKLLLELTIHGFRRVLLIKVAPTIAKEELAAVGEDEAVFSNRIAQLNSTYISSGALLSLLEAHTRQRTAFIETLPLELAVMEIIPEKAGE